LPRNFRPSSKNMSTAITAASNPTQANYSNPWRVPPISGTSCLTACSCRFALE
jgi:hypothetical protein